ncbi:MAG: ArsC/Spx/MgsR family protein [Saprospiraceae bacterium]|nr:ArsC/Spx/MgsR family protein [Saprospiraceae bacterium]
MKKLYYLSTCDTCRAIIKRLGGLEDYVWQDIKTESITASQLKEMKEMSGSYETLFSRRAIKYKELGLKDQVLQEKDFQRLILKEYTFLKRPVIISGDKLFIGNEEKTVAAAEQSIRIN